MAVLLETQRPPAFLSEICGHAALSGVHFTLQPAEKQLLRLLFCGCLKGGSTSVQVLLNGIGAVVVLTLEIQKS